MYRRMAAGYDRLERLAEGVRRESVERMQLKDGDVVLDVGCGTGLSLPLIEARIGTQGTVVGIDLSAEMLAKAKERVEDAGWQNVTLIESSTDDAEIPVRADAALFHFTHDIMRSRPAVENVARHMKTRGRIVSAGGKWAPWWALPANLVMWRISSRYVTTFEGFDRPWSHLKPYLPDLRVKSVLFGCGYIAWGTVGGGSQEAI
jgi:ubiquinone/menaquinone biosynthesis C-methylase UbiE